MKLVVGISDASGVIYGLRLLAYLKKCSEVETRVVMDDAAKQRISAEMQWQPDMVAGLAEQTRDSSHVTVALPPSSGMEGMIVAPCSLGALTAIANAESTNSLTQAANTCLEERKRLFLLVTETPVDSDHLALMHHVSQMGAVILPACPDFDMHPVSVDDIVNHTVCKVLELLGIPHGGPRLCES